MTGLKGDTTMNWRTRLGSASLGILAAVCPLHAQVPEVLEPPTSAPAPMPAPAVAPALPDGWSDGGTSGGRFWTEAEYLIWWMRGTSPPPLVTTSPAGTAINQAGVLGTPGTTVLFGGSADNTAARSGFRIATGYWFDDNQTYGIEADFFLLETKAANFSASSNGNPIISRPFTDANSGLPSAERVAFPGDVTGSIGINNGTEGLLGTSLMLRENVYTTENFRFGVLGGYRYLHFADRLGISENLTNVNPNNTSFVPLNANFSVNDSFDAKNDYNAFNLGIVTEWRYGRLSLGLRSMLAVGYNHEAVDITGSTIVSVPGATPVSNQGGLLALSSNIGHHEQNMVALVPQFDLKLAYQITPRLTATLGYTYLYFSDVVRAANQVDTTVNSTLIPPATAPSGPNRPAFAFERSSLWAQGISLGLQYVF
jgi:Putative beta barrel porin-7 (BBP7)